ncbi:uncharacterized protein METZ01_LOCUS483970, partial [marine metagenome]
MFQMRFLINILLMLAIGIASVEIPVSGEVTAFTLESETSNSLAGVLKSGDLFLHNIDMDEGTFTSIQFQGYHQSNIIGSPELPEIHKLIEIPQDAVPRIEIINKEVEYYNLGDYGIENPIFPHQPSLSKSQDPDDVPFEWNEALFQTNAFIEHELISVELKGQLRSLRLANLVIRPI